MIYIKYKSNDLIKFTINNITNTTVIKYNNRK